jgi:hypothetical protein
MRLNQPARLIGTAGSRSRWRDSRPNSNTPNSRVHTNLNCGANHPHYIMIHCRPFNMASQTATRCERPQYHSRQLDATAAATDYTGLRHAPTTITNNTLPSSVSGLLAICWRFNSALPSRCVLMTCSSATYKLLTSSLTPLQWSLQYHSTSPVVAPKEESFEGGRC